MTEKLGTENVKIVLHLGFAFGKQFETALEDKKIDWKDVPGFLGLFMQIQPVIAAGKQALKEALDLDAEERQEINDWSKTEFDLKNDEVEKKVKASLDFGISALMLKAAFTPASEPKV